MFFSTWRPAFGLSCTEFVYPECWHFNNDATNKIDVVLTEHGGLHDFIVMGFELGWTGLGLGLGGFGTKSLGPGLDNIL